MTTLTTGYLQVTSIDAEGVQSQRLCVLKAYGVRNSGDSNRRRYARIVVDTY